MALQLKNNATTTLAADIAAGDTTISVADGTVFATLSTGDYFYCTLANTDNTTTEIVKVNSISGNDLTVERGYEGTTALAFVSGDTVEQRITRQTLLELGGDPKIVTRDYLDEVNLGIDGKPVIDEAKIRKVAKKTAPKLMENWDSYFGPKLNNTILDMTNNVILEDSIKFNTVADIATWLSTNFPGNTPTLVMKPFETINHAIPTMTKAYGMNRFFSSLKGRRGNGKTKSVIEPGILSQTDKDNIFNAAHGTALNGATDNAFWIANSQTNMYSTLYRNALIQHSTNNAGLLRGEWDTGSSQWQSITQGSDFKRKGVSPTEVWMDHNMNVSTKSHGTHYYMKNDVSRMLAYPLERDDGQTLSVMFKPIGMDCFVLDFPNFNDYYLEAVAYNDTIQGSTHIKSFGGTGDFTNSDFDYTNGKMRVDINNFFSLIQTPPQKSNNANYNEWTTGSTIRFRLRNKVTNEVSELSKYGIVYDMRHKFGTFRFMVKHFNK